MMGRPTKLTQERQDKIVTALRAGNYRVAAYGYAAISHQTFLNWMERGEAESDHVKAGKKARAKERIYLDFFDAVTRAEAAAEVEAVAMVRKAMPDDWRAAMEFLRRRHVDRWGKTVSEVTVDTPDGVALVDKMS